MKRVLFISLLGILAACGSLRPTSTGTLECQPDAKSGKHDCKDIPVIVLLNGSECIALLPYHTLHVATNKKPDHVSWTIFGAPEYAFVDDDGIAVIRDDPRQVWDERKKVSDRTIRWRIKAGAPAASFQHDARVYNTATKKPCTPPDPVITNDGN